MRYAFPLLLALCANSASAATLWNQTGPASYGMIDQNITDITGGSTFMVDDFTTLSQTWNLSTITCYYISGSGDWSAVTTGEISFFAKTTSLPTEADTPGATATVNVTVSQSNGVWALSADLSSIAALQGISGTFWIGMTPNTAIATQGQQFHALLNSPHYGDLAVIKNPANAFGFGSSWISTANRFLPGDMEFALTGTAIPAPTSASFLCFAAAIAPRRRRS